MGFHDDRTLRGEGLLPRAALYWSASSALMTGTPKTNSAVGHSSSWSIVE